MSKWVEHIRDFAKRNNLTYGCALSDPKCSEEYRIKFPKPAKKGKKGKKLDLSKTEFVPLEEAEIDTEPKTKMIVEKKPPAPEPKETNLSVKEVMKIYNIISKKYNIKLTGLENVSKRAVSGSQVVNAILKTLKEGSTNQSKKAGQQEAFLEALKDFNSLLETGIPKAPVKEKDYDIVKVRNKDGETQEQKGDRIYEKWVEQQSKNNPDLWVKSKFYPFKALNGVEWSDYNHSGLTLTELSTKLADANGLKDKKFFVKLFKKTPVSYEGSGSGLPVKLIKKGKGMPLNRDMVMKMVGAGLSC